MSQLVIDLPEPLNQQIEESGLSKQQLSKVMTYLLEMYLKIDEMKGFVQSVPAVESKKAPRKAGSAKHLGIIISDDFDAPLDDFAENN